MTNKRLEYAALFASLGALLLLAVGVWGAWLPQPAAGLTILGIDLPEYVKFVPEVQSGAIPLHRETFFLPLISLVGGMLLVGTWRRSPLPLWQRGLLLALTVPVILAMLPPAWTPFLMRQPEFRPQVHLMAGMGAAVLLSPLWLRLGERLRGVLWLVLALLPWGALRAYVALQPALSALYQQPLSYGPGFYATIGGAVLLLWAGVFLLAAKQNRA